MNVQDESGSTPTLQEPRSYILTTQSWSSRKVQYVVTRASSSTDPHETASQASAVAGSLQQDSRSMSLGRREPAYPSASAHKQVVNTLGGSPEDSCSGVLSSITPQELLNVESLTQTLGAYEVDAGIRLAGGRAGRRGSVVEMNSEGTQPPPYFMIAFSN